MTPVTRSPSWMLKLALHASTIAVLMGLSLQPKASVLPADHIVIASHLYYPEVRLRKLHLVRPDLIPYPIFYDIYC